MSEEGVFCHKLGLAFAKVGEGLEWQERSERFGPLKKASSQSSDERTHKPLERRKNQDELLLQEDALSFVLQGQIRCLPFHFTWAAPLCATSAGMLSRISSDFSRTDVPSGMPLRGREEDDTSYRKRKSGRSMRRNEGSSQYRGGSLLKTSDRFDLSPDLRYPWSENRHICTACWLKLNDMGAMPERFARLSDAVAKGAEGPDVRKIAPGRRHAGQPLSLLLPP